MGPVGCGQICDGPQSMLHVVKDMGVVSSVRLWRSQRWSLHSHVHSGSGFLEKERSPIEIVKNQEKCNLSCITNGRKIVTFMFKKK